MRQVPAHVLGWVASGLAPYVPEQTAALRPGFLGNPQIGAVLQVLVRDNNIEQALKVLKKRMQREGIFREMKQRKAYEKPSERRVREAAEAVRRTRKAARKKAQREGLIAAPKRAPKRPVAAPR